MVVEQDDNPPVVYVLPVATMEYEVTSTHVGVAALDRLNDPGRLTTNPCPGLYVVMLVPLTTLTTDDVEGRLNVVVPLEIRLENFTA